LRAKRSNLPATTESKEIQMAKKNKRQANFRAASVTREEFNPDYSITKRDLKRIGILAGSFIVLLIVLSFFIR
jgi:hypothetical protein